MSSSSAFLSHLSPSLRDSLESIARIERTSIDDLLIIAIAEKVARSEHSAWLSHQASWMETALAARKAREQAMRSDAELSSVLPDSTSLSSQQSDEEEERRRLGGLFEGAPVFLAVLGGPEHVFEMVNQSYRDLLSNRELIGKRVVDCVPEVAETVWMARLDRVYRTGEPLVERGALLSLASARGLPLEDKYVDYAYKARHASDGSVSGIIVIGVDTTLVQRVLESTTSDAGVIEILR
jgi:hypothetical protein